MSCIKMNRCVTTLAFATWLLFSATAAYAQLNPEEVPAFQIRARVASFGGRKPDASQDKFSFRYDVPSGHVASEGDQWSAWLKFEREQIEATLKGYPAIYMKSWPVVVRLVVGGVVDSTVVELELMFDESQQRVKLAGELYGPRLGILIERDESGKPKGQRWPSIIAVI